MKSSRFIRLAGALIAPVLSVGMLSAQSGVASASSQRVGGTTLFVAPSGNPHHSGRSCHSARFSTIQSAINAARANATIIVCPGTYHEQVVIAKRVSLVGQHATIDESGVTPTFTVTIPGLGRQTIFAAVIIARSGVTLTGFTIQHAEGEGVLAVGPRGPVSRIVISGNAVVHNDLGVGDPPNSKYFQCAAQGQVPGDCGEGVHFAGNVAFSVIQDNFIAFNSGGVLLSDDMGPTHNNMVEHNVVTENASDCGITVPGHNPGALSARGVRRPRVAGVYRNVISNNVVTDNGLKGEGAGVLFANAGPGTASYDNLVEGNFIAGNELSGVTMHAHTIGRRQFEDLNGNRIVGNTIGKNNIGGDPLDFPVSPQDLETTGVLVFSGGVRVAVTIARNRIYDNHFGIWLSKRVRASGLGSNTFIDVTVPVSAHH